MISPWLLSSFIRPHQSNPSSGRSLAAQVFDDVLGLGRRDYAGKLLEAGLAQAGEAAEPPQKLLGGALAYPGDIHQRRVQRAARAALAVKGDRKPVGFVADLLDQVQDGRVALEHDRLVLLPKGIDYFLFFRDAGKRLIDDLEFFERRSGRVQLPDAAVDQDQARQRLSLFPQAAGSPLERVAPAGHG